ncbi:hypothetical protein Dsin_001876 [Dipteronia sinensis]|uniref:Uncharacterized protein n=1 Tax=Dipteronia sinensis TaxID=43782 RepID=A0AAE0B632_9ROSI|nr:hypothetical protein Dsin_001876 [Dipteronia sinensis]
MGELRDVDLHEAVGVTWFQRFQTNFMDLQDTSLLHIQWSRIMPTGVGSKPPKALAPGQRRPECGEDLPVRHVQTGSPIPNQIRVDLELKVVFTINVAWDQVSCKKAASRYDVPPAG